MPVQVRIPTPLRKITANKDQVETTGTNVGEVINNIEKAHPGLKERLCDEDGKVRRFVNIFLNDEDIRFLDGLGTPVKDGDELAIVPAIAGGCCRH